MKKNSISVVLSTKDDRWLLGAQLESIVDQLEDDDELILLDDGSDERTQEIIGCFNGPNIHKFRNEESVGVCRGINFCVSKATKPWLIGCSGNDTLLPTALEVFRLALYRFPKSRVMTAHCCGDYRPNWSGDIAYLSPNMLPFIWRAAGWHLHGAGVFVRRDCWGKGYIPELDSWADGFVTFINAIRHGIVHIPAPITIVRNDPNSFSAQRVSPEQCKHYFGLWLKEWSKPEYDDVRELGQDLFDMFQLESKYKQGGDQDVARKVQTPDYSQLERESKLYGQFARPNGPRLHNGQASESHS